MVICQIVLIKKFRLTINIIKRIFLRIKILTSLSVNSVSSYLTMQFAPLGTFAPVHLVPTFVLDEADEMFDMGFREDIEKSIGFLPYERQTTFFSATMDQEIMDFAARYQSCLSFIRQKAYNFFNIFSKAHIKHFISLREPFQNFLLYTYTQI